MTPPNCRRCGQTHELHQHYRRGTDAPGCPAYQGRRLQLAADITAVTGIAAAAALAVRTTASIARRRPW